MKRFNLESITIESGQITVGWIIDGENNFSSSSPSDGISDEATPKPTRTIDLTLKVDEMMEGPGFIGIGFNKQIMNDAEIWYCWINEEEYEKLIQSNESLDDECPSPSTISSVVPMFKCCLTQGGLHVLGGCSNPQDDDVYYGLEVVDWCLSAASASVTIRAPVCNGENNDSNDNDSDQPALPAMEVSNHLSGKPKQGRRQNCFQITSSTDFIVAYNPFSASRTHGYYRRTQSQVNLYAGILTQSVGETADEGLIATHGVFMLVAWMLIAPWAVYVSFSHERW